MFKINPLANFFALVGNPVRALIPSPEVVNPGENNTNDQVTGWSGPSPVWSLNFLALFLGRRFWAILGAKEWVGRGASEWSPVKVHFQKTFFWREGFFEKKIRKCQLWWHVTIMSSWHNNKKSLNCHKNKISILYTFTIELWTFRNQGNQKICSLIAKYPPSLNLATWCKCAKK